MCQLEKTGDHKPLAHTQVYDVVEVCGCDIASGKLDLYLGKPHRRVGRPEWGILMLMAA